MSTHMHKSKLYIHNMHYIQKHVNHCMKIIIIYHNVSISTSLMFSSHTISHNEYYSIYKGILDAPWCPCNRQVKRGVSLVGCISDITWLVVFTSSSPGMSPPSSSSLASSRAHAPSRSLPSYGSDARTDVSVPPLFCGILGLFYLVLDKG
jgi:hypothetical protein